MQAMADHRADYVVADQSAVTALMADPSTYPGAPQPVERIDTHAAIIFLAGDRAYKVKRAVHFPFMDFSTLALRKAACDKEIVINRRTADDLYLRVIPVTRGGDGALALDGEGPAVEWVVLMRRFAQEGLFDRMADEGRLTPGLMTEAIDRVIAFHRDAAVVPDDLGLRWVVEENLEELRDRPDLFAPEETEAFAQKALATLGRTEPLLARRAQESRVRHCHGDLHLRNICTFKDQATLFDAIEFNDAIAHIDVLYDLAFLLMDLDQRGLGDLANLCLNRYVHATDEYVGLSTLPLFQSTRATIRAKVEAAAAAGQTDSKLKAATLEAVRHYFEAANAYLDPPPPRLIAIGGLSGTGKSTLGRALAPAVGARPGAVHLRSDIIRKSLCGVDEFERLPEDAYSTGMNSRVYARLAERTATALEAGHSVVADAVYLRPEERDHLEKIAKELRVPFSGLWLDAPEETIVGRVADRRADASDATPDVVRFQLGLEPGDLRWKKVDAGKSIDAVTKTALLACGFHD